MFINIREGLSSKPLLVPVSEYTENYIKTPNRDWYKSLYYYNETHKAKLDKQIEEGQVPSLAGIRDTVTDRLFFDFDSKEDLNLARQDAMTTAERLLQKGIPEESIGIYFTGSKGFNIEVIINETLTPQQFRAAVFNVSGDLQTFDKVVNDPNRIVRIAGTKHQDTGLYKIPLTADELCDMSFTIDDIKKKAARRRIIETNPTKADLPKELLVRKEEPTVNEIKKSLTFDLSTFDMKARPKGIDEARWLLLNGFFRLGENERNFAMLCLAATFKNQGYSKEHADALLKGVATIQAKRTGDEEFLERDIEKVTNQVFSDSWQGGQFTTKDPNNWLAKYARKMGITVKEEDNTPKTIMGIAPGFTSYIKDFEKNTMKTGIRSLDKALHLMVGMGLAVVAPPSVGKTSLALEILEHNSMAGHQIVFVSLDMTRNRLFQKIAHRVTGMNKDELYAAFRNGKHDEVLAKVQKHFGNVWFLDKSATTIEDVKEFVKGVEQQTGEKVKMVMIDYFERINSTISDANSASLQISNQIQDMINDLNILCITLFQPAKHAYSGGPDVEIVSYAAIKGSSHIIQAQRAIISLSRPFFTPKTKELDKFIVFNILKNDLGELDRLEYSWEGRTGKIKELEDIERKELHDLMKLKAGEKDDKGSGGWD